MPWFGALLAGFASPMFWLAGVAMVAAAIYTVVYLTTKSDYHIGSEEWLFGHSQFVRGLKMTAIFAALVATSYAIPQEGYQTRVITQQVTVERQPKFAEIWEGCWANQTDRSMAARQQCQRFARDQVILIRQSQGVH